MKILDVYKSMAKELFIEAEVDDDKIIKYKKEDGEQGEMKASSAKTMPKDHPAKIEYDKMTDSDSDSDTSKGQALSGSDFDRDGDGDVDDDDKDYEPTYYDDDAEFEKKYGYEPDAHVRSFNDEEREEIINKMADDSGVSIDDPIELVKIVRDKDEYGNASLGDIHKHIKDMADKDDDGSDKPESELDALDKKIKDTEANMNMAASNYGDPRQQELAGELYQDLEKLKAKREKLAGGSDKNETKVINGKKYKEIKESKKEKTFAEKVKENSKRFAKRK